MLAELAASRVELPGEKTPDEELWDYWVTRAKFRTKKERAVMTLFQLCIDLAEKDLPWWTMDLYERSLVGLKLDMFKSQRFRERLILKAKLMDAGEGAAPHLLAVSLSRTKPSGPSQTTLWESVLRSFHATTTNGLSRTLLAASVASSRCSLAR